HLAEHSFRRRAPWPTHRLQLSSRILRPYSRLNEPGRAGVDCIRRDLRRPRHSRPHTQLRIVPLVFGEQPACALSNDVDDRWALQRAERRIPTLDLVLKRRIRRRPKGFIGFYLLIARHNSIESARSD